MLTGTRLFSGSTVLKIIGKVLRKEIVGLSEARQSMGVDHPTIPTFLEETMLKALERDLTRRFQSAREMRAALDQVTSEPRRVGDRADKIDIDPVSRFDSPTQIRGQEESSDSGASVDLMGPYSGAGVGFSFHDESNEFVADGRFFDPETEGVLQEADTKKEKKRTTAETFVFQPPSGSSTPDSSFSTTNTEGRAASLSDVFSDNLAEPVPERSRRPFWIGVVCLMVLGVGAAVWSLSGSDLGDDRQNDVVRLQLGDAVQAFEEGKIEKSSVLFRHRLLSHPVNPHILYYLGRIEASQSNYAEARVFLERCVDLDRRYGADREWLDAAARVVRDHENPKNSEF
jgi:hypothetical protein